VSQCQTLSSHAFCRCFEDPLAQYGEWPFEDERSSDRLVSEIGLKKSRESNALHLFRATLQEDNQEKQYQLSQDGRLRPLRQISDSEQGALY
jgi:hypothetical protein